MLGERRGRPTEDKPQNFAEYAGKETREIAAKKAGFGNPETYRQAKAVVEEGIPELVEKMDRKTSLPSRLLSFFQEPPFGDRTQLIFQLSCTIIPLKTPENAGSWVKERTSPIEK